MNSSELYRRPPLYRWMKVRGIKPAEIAALLGCSGEWVRRLLLRWDDPNRARPSAAARRKIKAYTEEAIDLTDWEPETARAAA